MLYKLKPHNQAVYDELYTALKLSHRAIIVQATGTGKGIIANNLIFDMFNGKRILILVPQNSLKDSYSENLGVSNKIVDIECYQSLCFMEDEKIKKISKMYDLVILDEVHRAGSPKVSKKIDTLLYNFDIQNKYSIGLTATSVRYSDKINVSERFFNNNIIYGLDLVNAIIKGILPTFTYVASLYCLEDEVKNIQTRIDGIKNKEHPLLRELEAPLKYLKLNSSEEKLISDIVQKEIKNLGENQKWIVFSDGLDKIDELKKKIPRWFNKEVNIFEVHSHKTKLENSNIIKYFNEVDNGINILISVNMLNEGLHIKGITGLFMLRKTFSNIIFLQQLGRALDTSKKLHNPIIFDFIGNYRNIMKDSSRDEDRLGLLKLVRSLEKSVNAYFEEEQKVNLDYTMESSSEIGVSEEEEYEDLGIKKNRKINKNCGRKRKPHNRIIVKNYIEDIANVLDNVNNVISQINKNSWTNEEDNILIKYYPKEGIEVKKRLPNRSESSIYTRVYELNIKSDRFWTPEQIEVLKRLYPKYGRRLAEMYHIFGDKTADAIESKARELGIKTNKKLNEDKYKKIMSSKEFQEDYKKFGPKVFDKYGIPDGVGRGYIQRNGLKYDNDVFWTEEEDRILIELYPKIGYKVIEYLPGRTEIAIQGRVKRLGLKKEESWPTEKVKLLKKVYSYCTNEELLQYFPEKTIGAIKRKAQSLGLKKIKK